MKCSKCNKNIRECQIQEFCECKSIVEYVLAGVLGIIFLGWGAGMVGESLFGTPIITGLFWVIGGALFGMGMVYAG